MSAIRIKPEIKKTVPRKPVIMFLCFSAAVILLGITLYKSERNLIFKEQGNSLKAIASLKIRQIEQWHSERIGDATVIKNDRPLIRSIRQFLNSSNNDLRIEISRWMKSVLNGYDYSNILLLDTLHNVRLTISQSDIVPGDVIEKDLKEVLINHNIIMTDIHRSEDIPWIHLDILVPLIDSVRKKEISVGIIILRVSPEKILFPLIQSWPVQSKSSETLLIRREGDSVLFINELRHRQNTALNLRFSIKDGSLPAAKAVNGVLGLVQGMDYRNIPVVAWLADVPDFSWKMVAKVDKEEILLPLKRYTILIFITVVLLILINASLFGFWIWQQQISSYKKQLQNEKSIHELEERYRSLYENVSIGIYRTTLDGRILMANPAMVRMLGFDTFEQLAQRNLQEEGYEPDHPRSKFLESLERDGRIIGLESAWNQKNGEVLIVRESANTVRDSMGRILYFDGTVEDITERKKTEEALHESEDKFKYVFDHSIIGKSITFPTGEIHVNKALCDLLGYSEKELESRKWQDITPPEDIELTQKIIDSLISGEKRSVRFIKRYTHKNGAIVWTELSTALRRDDNGKPLYFMTAIVDITERKKAEESLRLKNFVFNDSIAANSISDINGFITEVNASFLRIWGYTVKNDVIGKPISHFLKDNSDSKVIVDVLSEFGEWEGDYIALKNDGSTFIAHGLATRIKDEDGATVGYQSAVIDVTEAKKAQEIINNLNEELEQKVKRRTELLEVANKELESFSYSVSHDLRAPLRSVHGYTKILMEEYEHMLDEEGKRICGIISSSATQMGELIDDLLNFSRIGRSSLNPSLLDMKSIVVSVFSDISSAKEKSRTKMKIGKLHKALGDANLIKLVWNNLISNAIKYSSKENISEIVVSSQLKYDRIIYSVKDNGVGFDMNYKHKLFGVFQRLHSESEFEGNGVGLAIVQRIILKHGGKVWAEGEIGKGATFYFSLPVQDKRQK